jgi:hypothetical protein
VPNSQNELDSILVVEAAGIPYSVEKEYKISIDRQFTTAVEGTHFRMPDKTVFKAGAMRDTLAIKFIRTEEMKDSAFRLVLRVEENENFKLGQIEYQYKVFIVHDKIAQPAWWTTTQPSPTLAYLNVATNYLGTYSDLKYRYFIEVTGKVDFPGALADNISEIMNYARLFKYWLAEQKLNNNTILEENGNEMTVPVGG